MIESRNSIKYPAKSHRAGNGVAMIQILLCDDNEHFLRDLQAVVRQITNARNIGAKIYVSQGGQDIPEHTLKDCDIFFLDIDLGDAHYNGMDIARRVRQFNPNAIIIFITDYIEFAPEGYEVQAFRYLLKDDVSKKLEHCLIHAIDKLHVDYGMLQINISGEPVTLALNHIVYIESDAHAVLIHVKKPDGNGTKTYRCYEPISNLDAQLSPQGFIRVHRSFLVNTPYIKSYQYTGLTLIDGNTIPVSRKSYTEKKKEYMLWKTKGSRRNRWNT